MSQGGALSSSGSGSGSPIETLTGNSGGPVPPDAAFNIDILGNNAVGIDIVGNAGTNTLTVMGIPSSTTQIGVIEIATNAETIAGTDTIRAVTPDDLTAKLGIQTSHGVAIGAGTSSALSWTGTGSAGQILTSNGAVLDPTFQSISATGAITSITGNTGGAQNPLAGNFNILGTGSITVAGTANTETVQLTGLTNHNILVGAGTATITKVAPSATSGVPLISQGAAADPAFGTAVVAGGGTGVTSNTAFAVLTGGTTATNPIQSIASVGTAGQVLTSSGAGALPVFSTNTFVQQVRASTASVVTINTNIPFDNTIPQITEGTEVITVTITPTNTNSILVIQSNFFGTPNAALSFVGAYFQDATANALYATAGTGANNGNVTDFSMLHFMTAGTTSATTFRLRVGVSANTLFINADNAGTRYFGGVATATIFVTEYRA